jgi:DNA-binding response OmpR family regulator
LIVEDDPGIPTSQRTGLVREGYQVNWKDKGKDGFDVCRRIRTQKIEQPILMITVHSDEMAQILGLEMGADDYMTKPFGIRELLSRIRTLIKQTYVEFSTTFFSQPQ